MSKFLVQSKSFLPMVIQKSATDMSKPTLDSAARFVAKQPNVKVVSKPENPSVVLTGGQQNAKGLMPGNPRDLQAHSRPRPGTAQRVEAVQQIPTVQKPLHAQQVFTESIGKIHSYKITSSTPRTLFAAFKLDLELMQERAATSLVATRSALGHMWLHRRQSGLLRTLQVRDNSEQGPREGLVWLEGKTRPIEEERPVPVILPAILKRKPTQTVKTDKVKEGASKKDDKSKSKACSEVIEFKQFEYKINWSFHSNFLVNDKAPEWKLAISNWLGALQKTVVRKLSDGKK